MHKHIEPFAALTFLVALGATLTYGFWLGFIPTWLAIALFVSGVLAGSVVEDVLFDLVPNATVPAAWMGFGFLTFYGLVNFTSTFGPMQLAMGTVGFSALLSWTGTMLKMWFGPSRSEAAVRVI